MVLIVTANGEVSVEQKSMQVEYDITTGSVNNLTSDINTTSLIINITAPDNGELKIIIPRMIVDSEYNEEDDIFYIIIDGEEIDFKETITKDFRTLEIPYVKGSKQIEIIGTTSINSLETIDEDLALAIMIST
ncbi:MAG: hypothetical protein DRH89_07335 [Candidatus Cloacimonadota bacterium]|nr:MAG: hypothetical protein DRH89_07335 [Candidatus Cloacimonadota bacterium]